MKPATPQLTGSYVDRYIMRECSDAIGFDASSRLSFKGWVLSDDFLDACVEYIRAKTVARLDAQESE
jgi:hypothetical protein